MDTSSAWRLLGLGPPSQADDLVALRVVVREAYVSRLFELHPDVADEPDPAATAALIEAFSVVRQSLETGDAPGGGPGETTNGPATEPEAPPAPVIGVAIIDDGTIGIEAPPPETLGIMLDAAHRLGEITYIEPGSGLVQVLVEFVDGPVCQILLTTQGRATGVTEVFCSVESLDLRPPPPAAAVTRLFVDTITGLRSPSSA